MLVTMKEILDRAKKDNYGVTSIMVDRSSLSYEDNIAQTKETVKMCRPLNISVEAELGHVGQSEDYSSDVSDHFTKPENGIQKVNLTTELVVAGKEELETFIQDKNFDKWQLIPSFIKGYSDRLEHYVNLFDQENRAW